MYSIHSRSVKASLFCHYLSIYLLGGRRRYSRVLLLLLGYLLEIGFIPLLFYSTRRAQVAGPLWKSLSTPSKWALFSLRRQHPMNARFYTHVQMNNVNSADISFTETWSLSPCSLPLPACCGHQGFKPPSSKISQKAISPFSRHEP